MTSISGARVDVWSRQYEIRQEVRFRPPLHVSQPSAAFILLPFVCKDNIDFKEKGSFKDKYCMIKRRRDGLFLLGILDELFPAAMGESLLIEISPNVCLWFHSELQSQLSSLHL